MLDKTPIRLTKDGFINICLLGSCPEIKMEGTHVLIRNSQNPNVVVTFSLSEFKELKQAVLDGIV